MANTAPNEPATSCGFQGANRRAMVRFRCAPPSPGSAFFANSSTSARALVLDLSVGGIGLILNRPVEIGELLRIELQDSDKTSFELTAHVVNVTPLPDGTWRCGCAFLSRLAEEELKVLLR
jgi:hypothetical protein